MKLEPAGLVASAVRPDEGTANGAPTFARVNSRECVASRATSARGEALGRNPGPRSSRARESCQEQSARASAPSKISDTTLVPPRHRPRANRTGGSAPQSHPQHDHGINPCRASGRHRGRGAHPQKEHGASPASARRQCATDHRLTRRITPVATATPAPDLVRTHADDARAQDVGACGGDEERHAPGAVLGLLLVTVPGRVVRRVGISYGTQG